MNPPVSAIGFHAAMGDGSVRFLTSNIGEDVLRRLIVRNDGKPLPDGWDR